MTDEAAPDDAIARMLLEKFPGATIDSVRHFATPEEREAYNEEREAEAARRREENAPRMARWEWLAAEAAKWRALVDAGSALPVVPMPEVRGMHSYEHDLRAACTLRHSAWYHLHRKDHRLNGWQFGERLLRTGWPWYHQSTDDRTPRMCSTHQGLIGWLANGPADRDDVEAWRDGLTDRGYWRTHETTCTAFTGYKGLFFVDSDWDDRERAAALRATAEKHFGPLTLVRGRCNSHRIAFPLRLPEGVPLPGTFRVSLLTGGTDDRGRPVTSDVEFKMRGQSLTLLGMHSSNVTYAWESRIPGFDGCTLDEVPVVTWEQVQAFADDLRTQFADVLHMPAAGAGGAVEVELTEEGLLGLRSTARAVPSFDGRWEVDDEGMVVQGRGEWPYGHACNLIWINRGKLRDLLGVDNGGDGLAVAVSSLVRTLREDIDRLVRDGGRHSKADMRKGAQGVVQRAWASKWPKLGDWDPYVERRADGRDVLVIPPPAAPTSPAVAREAGDDDLAGLLSEFNTEAIKGVTVTTPDAALAAARARPVDRSAIEAHVAGTVDAAIAGFFDQAEEDRDQLLILKAPTGSGKTSRLLAYLLQLKAVGRLTRPVLVLQQNYALITESVERVDAADVEVSDEERQALAGAAAQARAAGLKAMVYEGKPRLCVKPAMKILAARGIATGDLCSKERKGEKDKDGRKKFDYCEHYEGCPAITQKHKVANSDVVFLPSAYLTCKLPKELTENILAVVIDEAVHDQLLGEGILSFKDLMADRRETMLTRKQRDAGDDADALRLDRRGAVALVREAILAGKGHRIPEWLFDTSPDDLSNKPLDLVRAAQRVVSDALRPVGVRPDMDAFKAEFAVKAPSAGLWAEWHFWDVVEDRMLALPHRRMWDEHRKDKGIPFPAGAARGDRDVRLQVLDTATDAQGRPCIGPDTVIRVSYRRKPNWQGIPVMLLDASADAAVTRKLWPGRDVRVVEVAAEDARPHVRVVWCPEATYSDSSLLPYQSQGLGQAGPAAGLASLRLLLDGICAYYGQSQVLCCSTLGVELALLTAWEGPANLSTVHHGALVGLDFARDYPAAVVIGRQEPSPRAMDSRAGALSYDEPVPELPFDLLGTGVDANGKEVRYPLRKRTVAMLDGSDASVMVQSHPGEWGRRMQRLSTEEGNAQAFGRVRPVFKDGSALPPLVIYLGRVPPRGVIVDALATGAGLVGMTQAYRSLAADGGFAPALAPGIGVAGFGAETDPTTASHSLRGMSQRRLDALDHVAYRTSEGKERTGRVLANIDTAAVVRGVTAWEAANKRGAPTEVRVTARGRDLPALAPRALPEKLAAIVGTREQRAARRAELLPDAGAKRDEMSAKAVAANARPPVGFGDEAALVLLAVTRRATVAAPSWWLKEKLSKVEATRMEMEAYAAERRGKDEKLAAARAPRRAPVAAPAPVTAASAPVPEPTVPVNPDDPAVALLLETFQGAQVVAVRTLAPPDDGDAEGEAA